MYPQTHIYFAELLLGRTSDAITLGSLLPDLVIGPKLNHLQAHSLGTTLYQLLLDDEELIDFALGVISHGTQPRGLDYFGDEKYPGCERGYCFEKGLPLVQSTIAACNLPPRMGWWKAHNIIEMGIETHISDWGDFGRLIRQAFYNEKLIDKLGTVLAPVTGHSAHWYKSRIAGFAGYIEIYTTNPLSLAQKYNVQMQAHHNIAINIPEVADLIADATDIVQEDLGQFFSYTKNQVTQEIKALEKQT